MRTRVAVVLGLIVAVLASGWTASAALAVPPSTLDSGYVTDEAGVLSSGEADAVNTRLSELAQGEGGDLFVVFVDSFTDPSDSKAWADETAAQNNLDIDQYLIAVAVDDSQYAISADANGPLDDGDIDRVLQAMQSGLSQGDWDGAVIAAADAFPGQSGAADGSGIIWIVVLLIVIVAVVLIIVLAMRSRRRKAQQTTQARIPDPNDPYASASDEELEAQAGSALVRADDAITSSRQELGFAVAQYGDDSTRQFTQVIEAARAKVAEAFSLKQKIDDEVPDAPEQRRAWHIRIIQLCHEADDLLNANIEAFEELRKLEAEAPQALERIKARHATAQQTLGTAAPALTALAQTYDATALAPVAENPGQAQQRLALADAELAEAETAIAAGRNGEAAFSIRTAEEAVEQSENLVDAVTSLGANLAAVEEQARAMITDIEADIAAAGAMPDAQGQLAPIVARTRSNLDAARSGLDGSPRNPQQILDMLTTANTEIDGALGQARQTSEQAQRTARMIEQRLTQAQAQIATANDFITTRRGAIGATARTRLAEANAAYSEAVAAQSADPALALDRASRAYSLASEALSSARSEVDTFNTGGWGGGGWTTGPRSGGSDFGEAILGGILGGLFSGGGGGGGGGGWSSGGGWRSSGSSRSSRPSSFGGGSSRSSSRSGGRSRGGRF
ncbi:TPM domain-containing protein [Microbacterium sp. YMB-B2]|uniref:TPM domain-containing protein n=1 Tax=Microbacterium tenebrionis TaxID=2830665 RepID=A0A9X1RZZ1_9MICO|nr:TPM domain-containing protein [Microbacterium tenebrionis]MCC2029264.1 TPM domain-containing protein [Microbacterium tenebrionis]